MAAKKKSAKKPDNGKFTQADLSRLREAMIKHRQRLSGDMASIQEEAMKPTDQDFSVDHMADHGSDNFDQEMNFGLIENVGRTVKEIDRALARIEDGSFGVCGACGVGIPKARLEYLPWARFCVACQTKLESGELFSEEMAGGGDDGSGEEGDEY